MNYVEPASVHEAVAALAADEDARCLAGGQTLMAMMNADIIAPSTLVGLSRIADLHTVSEADGVLRIGAMVTHATVADQAPFDGGRAVVRDAARQIAHPAIRNRGTIGGAVCHADAQADLPGALVAADARLEIAGSGVRREVPAADFFLDYFETCLADGEMLTAVLVPESVPGAVGTHLKFSRTDGDYAIVSVSSVIAFNDGKCNYARVVVGSAGPVPLHLEEVDALVAGSDLNDALLRRAGATLAAAADPVDDVRGTSEYRRLLIPGLVTRAIGAARERCNG